VKSSSRGAAALLLVVLCAGACGCGSKKGEHGHEAAKHVTEPPPPTPDSTPITTLRTPAGLVLKTEAVVPTATAGAAPVTPVPASTPSVTP
jgi:hypothetical protein